jgi:hypothetical protein
MRQISPENVWYQYTHTVLLARYVGSGLMLLTLIIDNLACLLEIHRVDAFVIAIILVSRRILDLTSVSRARIVSTGATMTQKDLLVEEEGIIRSSSLYQPMHGLNHVGLGRDLSWVPSIVGKHDDILWLVSVSFCMISVACLAIFEVD